MPTWIVILEPCAARLVSHWGLRLYGSPPAPHEVMSAVTSAITMVQAACDLHRGIRLGAEHMGRPELARECWAAEQWQQQVLDALQALEPVIRRACEQLESRSREAPPTPCAKPSRVRLTHPCAVYAPKAITPRVIPSWTCQPKREVLGHALAKNARRLPTSRKPVSRVNTLSSLRCRWSRAPPSGRSTPPLRTVRSHPTGSRRDPGLPVGKKHLGTPRRKSQGHRRREALAAGTRPRSPATSPGEIPRSRSMASHKTPNRQVLWVRIAEVTHRAADLARAFGDLEPALRRLANELASSEQPRTKRPSAP